ncbi:MAG: hypothetical protein KC964_25045, partial [Candidatus Omnitrophica bacterium]|nr:hypothetical protein [Candidatus Omnitrophota bacterium]
MTDQAEFTSEGVVINKYPYKPASVYPSGQIAYSRIVGWASDKTLPEIRLDNGEIIFLPNQLADSLAKAMAQHGVPKSPRVNVWMYLLVPYLDSSMDKAEEALNRKVLNDCGFTDEEVKEIRRRVSFRISFYNLLFWWEWAYLDLSDVFEVFLRFKPFTFPVRRQAEFYWWAIDIANRGMPLDEKEVEEMEAHIDMLMS